VHSLKLSTQHLAADNYALFTFSCIYDITISIGNQILRITHFGISIDRHEKFLRCVGVEAVAKLYSSKNISGRLVFNWLKLAG